MVGFIKENQWNLYECAQWNSCVLHEPNQAL